MMPSMCRACLAITLLLAAGCSDPASLPEIESVTCAPTEIPCRDGRKTAVTCTGKGQNLSGAATFTWKCFHLKPGVESCTYAPPAGDAETCKPFEDATICTSQTGSSRIEIRCTGEVRETCSLVIAQGDRVSDPRRNQGRFCIDVPAGCASPPDLGPPDGNTPSDGAPQD
jgi:hypothetical protein